jgi:hypothetical protein
LSLSCPSLSSAFSEIHASVVLQASLNKRHQR